MDRLDYVNVKYRQVIEKGNLSVFAAFTFKIFQIIYSAEIVIRFLLSVFLAVVFLFIYY